MQRVQCNTTNHDNTELTCAEHQRHIRNNYDLNQLHPPGTTRGQLLDQLRSVRRQLERASFVVWAADRTCRRALIRVLLLR